MVSYSFRGQHLPRSCALLPAPRKVPHVACNVGPPTAPRPQRQSDRAVDVEEPNHAADTDEPKHKALGIVDLFLRRDMRSVSPPISHAVQHVEQPMAQCYTHLPCSQFRRNRSRQATSADAPTHQASGISELFLRRGTFPLLRDLEHVPLPPSDLLVRRGRKQVLDEASFRDSSMTSRNAVRNRLNDHSMVDCQFRPSLQCPQRMSQCVNPPPLLMNDPSVPLPPPAAPPMLSSAVSNDGLDSALQNVDAGQVVPLSALPPLSDGSTQDPARFLNSHPRGRGNDANHCEFTNTLRAQNMDTIRVASVEHLPHQGNEHTPLSIMELFLRSTHPRGINQFDGPFEFHPTTRRVRPIGMYGRRGRFRRHRHRQRLRRVRALRIHLRFNAYKAQHGPRPQCGEPATLGKEEEAKIPQDFPGYTFQGNASGGKKNQGNRVRPDLSMWPEEVIHRLESDGSLDFVLKHYVRAQTAMPWHRPASTDLEFEDTRMAVFAPAQSDSTINETIAWELLKYEQRQWDKERWRKPDFVQLASEHLAYLRAVGQRKLRARANHRLAILAAKRHRKPWRVRRWRETQLLHRARRSM